jgi:hypothetical protein
MSRNDDGSTSYYHVHYQQSRCLCLSSCAWLKIQQLPDDPASLTELQPEASGVTRPGALSGMLVGRPSAAGGPAWVSRACRARYLSGLSTRSRAQRSAKSAVFCACRSMSRASRKRARARTGLPNPTNTCPGVLAHHPALAGSVGVPELVTKCCSDGLRGPVASDEALPSGPLPVGLSESQNILLLYRFVSHVRIDSWHKHRHLRTTEAQRHCHLSFGSGPAACRQGGG